MTDLVQVMNNNNSQVVTTSRQVAETFEKRHDHVMRDIRNLLKKDVSKIHEMFYESTQPDSYGRPQKVYLINKEGFLLLTSSYRGEGVLEAKIKILSETDMIPPSKLERQEVTFLNKLSEALRSLNLTIDRQYSVLDYRLDAYIPELNIAIEYDEKEHKYKQEQDELRERRVVQELGCHIIRVSEEESDEYSLGYVIQQILTTDGQLKK